MQQRQNCQFKWVNYNEKIDSQLLQMLAFWISTLPLSHSCSSAPMYWLISAAVSLNKHWQDTWTDTWAAGKWPEQVYTIKQKIRVQLLSPQHRASSEWRVEPARWVHLPSASRSSAAPLLDPCDIWHKGKKKWICIFDVRHFCTDFNWSCRTISVAKQERVQGCRRD